MKSRARLTNRVEIVLRKILSNRFKFSKYIRAETSISNREHVDTNGTKVTSRGLVVVAWLPHVATVSSSNIAGTQIERKSLCKNNSKSADGVATVGENEKNWGFGRGAYELPIVQRNSDDSRTLLQYSSRTKFRRHLVL